MKLNVISESQYFAQDQGVHTAFLTLSEMAREQGVDVVVNDIRTHADITHIHTPGPLGLYMLRTNKPSVISAHVVPASFVGSLRGIKYWYGLSQKFLKFYYNSADLVFAVGPLVKDQLREIDVTTRIEVLPNPVNTKVFKPDVHLKEQGRTLLGIPKNAFVFMCVGQVQTRKGIDDFIACAKKFPDAFFVWIGGRPFKSLTAVSSATEHNLANPPKNFLVKSGFSYDKMPALYNSADAFLFPSFQENAPMAVIEAAATGLPLILRNNEEYKRLYKENYLACDDISAFEKMVDKIQKDKEFYKKSSQQSLDLSQNYSLAVLGKTLVGYYRSLL